MAWLSGWTYRKSHIINNSGGSTFTNCQRLFYVHRSSGSDSGADVYIGTKCEADFDDIRFTSSDGTTLLDYWIEQISGGIATIWVEVDSLQPGDTTVYLYYGKADASAVSDGNATFWLFDHFDSYDTYKWSLSGSANWMSFSGSYVSFQCYATNCYLYSKTPAPNNQEYKTRCKFKLIPATSSYPSDGCMGFHNLGSDPPARAYHAAKGGAVQNKIYGYGNNGSTSFSFTDNVDYVAEVTWDANYYATIRMVESGTYNTSTTAKSSSWRYVFLGGRSQAGIRFDWMAVLLDPSPDPTHGIWGEEEAPVSKTLTVKYTLYQSKTLTAKYHILCTPKTLTVKYTLYQSRTLTIKYDIPYVEKILIIKYSIYQPKTLTAKWDILCTPKTLTMHYQIIGIVPKALTLKYTIWTGKPVTLKYTILQSKPLTMRYAIGAAKSLTAIYTIFQSKTLTIRYAIITSPTLTIKYRIEEFVHVDNRIVQNFRTGSSESQVGETLTGGTSGATGVVNQVIVTAGDWETGDAEGYVILTEYTGEFEDGEDLDGSISGGSAAIVDGSPTLLGPKVIKRSASKGIEDAYWTATVTCRGIYDKSTVANFRDIEILMKDHTGTYQQVFLGMVPDRGISHFPAKKQTILKCVSHSWYLVNRQLPDGSLTNVIWIPSGVSGYTSTLEPSVLWTQFLGGTSWQSIIGIYPQNIVPVADWGTAFRPEKKWGWNKSVKRWDAFMETLQYCEYIFEAIFNGGTKPLGIACPLDSISSYIGPSAVEFSDDTYIENISNESKEVEKPNLVTVTGARNFRILYFKNGAHEFQGETVIDLVGSAIFTNGSSTVTTDGDLRQELKVGDLVYNSSDDTYSFALAISTITATIIILVSNYAGTSSGGYRNISKYTPGYGTVIDGGTGAEASITTLVKTSGTWGTDAAGYMILSYDRTGMFVDGDTLIDSRGPLFGEAVADGKDEQYDLYDYYTYSYPVTEPPRAIEVFESVDEEVADSTTLIEDYAKKVYDFHQLDNTPYTVVFNKRTDLRLWQKIRITHRTSEIPAEWMRVVWIEFAEEGPTRTVTVVLKNLVYVESMIKMKRVSKYSDAKVLKDAIMKCLKEYIQIDDADILKIEGAFGTIELKDGGAIVSGKGIL